MTRTVEVDATAQAPAVPEVRPAFVEPSFDAQANIGDIGDYSGFTSAGLERWFDEVPEIQDIRVISTVDGDDQSTLWLPPDADGPRPLIVILHSWSSRYDQHAGIPYAMWADENGWAAIAPNFRGMNDDANATGSDLAVQDVVDAIRFATQHEGVDASRVYAVGYSAGGMMSLLLAGRHPELVTAVAAWGTPADLAEFSRHSAASSRGYEIEIATACGGDPATSTDAAQECMLRSAVNYLAAETDVAVYLGHGLGDVLVQPSQTANAFNLLADPADRFDAEQIEALAVNRVPDGFQTDDSVETFLSNQEPAAAVARQSGSTTVVFFEGGHEMIYRASARFFASDPGRG